MAGTYTISATFTNLEGFYLYAGDDLNNVASLGIYFTVGEARRFTLSEAKTVWLCATFSNSVDYYTLSNVMLNIGTTALPYKPYREPITYIIPEALQGSGKGVAGYNDTVDFENGKYIKMVSTDILTGTEYTIFKPLPDTRPWLYYIGANTLNTTAVNEGLICNAFNASTSGWAEQTIGNIMITNHYLIFTWYPEKTADDFRAFLAERYANGNPVIVTYPIEPIETDLAETIGNIIEIEEGGFLEFVNEHENAMPSHISYLRRL